MKKIFFIVCLLTSFELLSQSNYYVDGVAGNNSNNGTSLGTAWKTIQHAFDFATPGSTVHIRGGTYFENVYANVSGTAGNPITFRNYQNETVLLDGTGTSQADMLYIEDQSHLIIKNIRVQNKVVNYATGIVISCTPTGTVTDITLKNIIITGINWTSNPSAIPTSNNNSNPLLVYGSGNNQVNAITNLVIDSCELFSNITGFSEAMSVDGNVDAFIVSNNKVYANKNIGIDLIGNYVASSNPAVDQARNGVVRDNLCYNNVSSYATSAGIYVDGARDIVIERNTCYGNGWGIEVGCEENGSASNIIVRDNIVYDNEEAGIAIGGYTSATTGQVLNSSILNNTCLQNNKNNSGVGELYITKMSNCKIQNNVFYTNTQDILISRDNISPFSNNSINYNCWYTPNNNPSSITVNWGASTYSSFLNYKTGTGMDANSIYGDPLLVNSNILSPDPHLQTSSPCIDSGDPSFVPASGETDFFGSARVTGLKVDIGAHEYAAANSVNENENKLAVTVFPNPVTDEATFTIQGDELTDQQWELHLYDVFGREVLFMKSQRPQIIILRNGLKSGIYFYEILYGETGIALGKIEML